MKTELNIVEGMQFDRGYASPYMVTNSEKMEAVLEDPLILITDKDKQHSRTLAHTRTSGPKRQEVIDYCRRYRRRGFGYPNFEQAPRLVNYVAVKAPDLATGAKPCFKTSLS